jgi:hypothetical protein
MPRPAPPPPSVLLAAALIGGAAAAPARAQTAPPAPAPARAGAAGDSAGVRRAVLDYVEGFYEGDSTRLLRSVAPTVAKSGYARPHADSAYRRSVMPFPDGFMGYARRVREGRTRTPANAPKTVALLDVQDQTASAKLVAWWGTDYLLLAREDGRWLITHVLWQTPPAARP